MSMYISTPWKTKYRHRSIDKLYLRLLRELAAIDINSYEEYERYRAVKDYFPDYEKLKEIEFGFTRNLLSLVEELPNKIRNSHGISILVDGVDSGLNEQHHKKLITFSDFTVLKTNDIFTHDIDISGGERILDFWYGPYIGGCVNSAFEPLLDIRSGIYVPIPEKIQWVDPIRFNELEDEGYFEPWGLAGIRKLPLNNKFNLSLDGDFLGENHNVMKFGFILPSLDNIPLDIVRKLRRDYGEEFFRFQRTLRKFAHKFSEVDDEYRIKLIIEEIDEEITQLYSVFEGIKKTHRKLRIVFGLISIVFYLSITSPDIMQHLHTLFSGMGTAIFMDYMRDVRDAKARMEKSPFYFPLLLEEAKFN